jgi:hypothetical protein
VQEHRADRAAWEVKRDNGGLGYAEETRDWEKENPGPLLKDRMLHREKAPEMELSKEEMARRNAAIVADRQRVIAAQELQSAAEDARAAQWQALAPSMPGTPIGNPTAEKALIATALFSQKGAEVLRTLDPEEFQQPLNQHIAKAIGHLESYGVRASAVAVETYMRGEDQNIPGMVKSRTGILHGQLPISRIARSTEWDSSLPLGNVDRTQYGLQHLEATASPTVMAHSFRDEIHNQWVATKTQEAYQWGAHSLQSAHESPEGTTPDVTTAVQHEVRSRIASLNTKDQDIPRLRPSQSNQTVRAIRSRQRA